MRIAVCRTKRNDHGDMLCKAIAAGIVACGDEVAWVETRQDVEMLRASRATVMVCERHPDRNDGEYLLRNQVVDFADSMSLPRLVIETGFLKNAKAVRRGEQAIEKTYWAAGWGGIKRRADYCEPTAIDGARFEQLGLPRVPSHCSNMLGTVLVLGQVADGYAEVGLDMTAEYLKVIRECRKQLPGVEVTFRPHPAITQREIPRDYERKVAKMGFVVDPYRDLNLLLSNCRVAITWASNAAVDAMMRGVPIICLSDLNIAWDLSEHDVGNVAKPFVPPLRDRQQFVNRLAWCQWSLEEFSNGAAWTQLRTKIVGGR